MLNFWLECIINKPFHTDSISWFGFIPLFWRPQGPHGCLEKQNHPLISNLVLWCAKIGPKSHNFWKTSEMTRKTTKNDGFLTVFWSFWVLGPILAHQTAKFELSGQFSFSRHPWGPWKHQNSGMEPKSAASVSVYLPTQLSLASYVPGSWYYQTFIS